MPETTAFIRPGHHLVLSVLQSLDSVFLEEAGCFFAGGTRIVLELGEYRESRDVDFLCADSAGYRRIRETVREHSLGSIQSSDLQLARQVRADQYGVRTVVQHNESTLKFEIIREGRIALDGEPVASLPVTCLTRRCCFAEKFMANSDRGLDMSTLSRDIVDLAFMIEGWSAKDAQAGLALAMTAYGKTVPDAISAVIEKMTQDRAYRSRCINGLAITEPETFSRGLRALAKLI
ncbi:MAG: nucleotidyl transferase AbiEii/AbiGii toxin family protein [Arenicellales bacterium]|jgi:hypothetical protein|nr:nucleotidyl transferase AbiEii/AbiGii toxin family protein [Arenicellales bacterium]MDP6919669.1 nucleotidyl transferase AbiEii/AbiGii toxin family protein [Arenicellales bacterium]|tara:strand:+ start:866 stop:1567 length:702 start_codon:yes stop_codon:yes gene_type:complete